MLFCPKCSSLLKPKVDGKKKQMACSCGYKSKETKGLEITESIKKETKPEVAVVEEEQEAYPSIDQDCPKCKHDKAYFWEIQTRASDEPATKFFKCEKCKHTWRDYN